MPNFHLTETTELFKTTLFSELEPLLDKEINWTTSDFNRLFESYMNALLRSEFELFIKNSGQDAIRNGYVTKKIKSLHGSIEIKVPRDRSNMFESDVLTSYSSCTEELSRAIIKLYQLGLSTTDVSEYIDDIYGVSYSKQSISSITKVTSDIVKLFKERKLDTRYIAIYLDATYIPVKFDNTFEKQAIHLIVGINQEGYQEILGYAIGFVETGTLWADALDDMKSRGVETVDIFVSDGFVGLDKVIKERYPEARIQRCTVHIMRNILAKVTQRDRPIINAELSELFKMTTMSGYTMYLDSMLKRYPKYESAFNGSLENEYVTTYLDFPKLMHRTIKTTNRIEAVNQKIKTRIRFKQNFPNLDSLERILVSSIIAQNGKSNRTVGGLQDYNRMRK